MARFDPRTGQFVFSAKPARRVAPPQPGIQGPPGVAGPRGVQGPQGPQGPKGVDGTPGQTGPRGPMGLKGKDGREVELRANYTHVQWRYKGETGWLDLFAIPRARGGSGGSGAALAALEDYYTKAEIDALLSGLVSFGDPT